MRFVRRSYVVVLVLGAFTLTLLLNRIRNDLSLQQSHLHGQDGPLYNPSLFSPGTPKPAGENYTRVLVMARLSTEDTSWLDRDLPELPKKIYTVDAADSGLPANTGNEAMAYLTYIIDHYDSLPDIVLFFHPSKKSWHNNIVLDTDAAITIKLLSDAHVMRQGYFNTRCEWDPGCPDWLHVDQPRRRYDLVRKPEEPSLTSALFHDLFGSDVPIPRALSQPCCAQFAVSAQRIRQRPLHEYEHYRNWLLRTTTTTTTTTTNSTISGRILEYSWQYIFTGLFEFCPSQHRCYCDGYGVCFEGGEQGLQKWLDAFSEKERLDEDLLALWSAGDKGGSEKFRNLKNRSGRLGRDLDRDRERALRRGFDPRTRARECGRVWREGDGF
ncbi:uncharacterized protein Z520_01475 [Fonsecaea multimorphosa CBS 102226]|uniref:DUF3431 domain-containing protein n=1 Tax=Fonsecaea multimorphosa CBS 102226 TaxID=1442371 RepID=A0A0D2L1T2_9EURO|nr:uncharacterized protein Z520_01475 [Fonsecaea multimorphosa CBS 102226]KIY03009.1 hypothetical protein Z520_01475 [Fonsecaea multimorphosa CBS 102226]OAL30838.1 hypothetical protein AYO22_01458 [Fonsecaea multimorphosa]